MITGNAGFPTTVFVTQAAPDDNDFGQRPVGAAAPLGGASIADQRTLILQTSKAKSDGSRHFPRLTISGARMLDVVAKILPAAATIAVASLSMFNVGYFWKIGLHFLGIVDWNNIVYSFGLAFGLWMALAFVGLKLVDIFSEPASKLSDTISHYAPMLIAPLSKFQIRRAGEFLVPNVITGQPVRQSRYILFSASRIGITSLSETNSLGYGKRKGKMSDPRNDFVFRRDWKLLVAAVLALALVIGVIAYKYTGDFTGFARFGTSGQPSRD